LEGLIDGNPVWPLSPKTKIPVFKLMFCLRKNSHIVVSNILACYHGIANCKRAIRRIYIGLGGQAEFG